MNHFGMDISKMFLSYLFGICLGISGCMSSEPHCSKFSYDEQLLEKLVRMEFQMEKSEESNSVVVEALTADIVKLQANRDDLADELTKLRQDMKTFANLSSRNVIKQQDAVIAFSAKKVSNTAPEKGETLIFTSVTTNEGNGYSSTTGEFTVPVDGVYLFHDQMCIVEKKDFYHQISVDDNPATTERFHANSEYPICFTTVLTQQLRKGQKVSVQCSHVNETGKRLTDDDYRWNMFSGLLLRKA